MIVGLGNPGQKYLFTRHNIGFMAIDHFSNRSGLSFKEEKKALTCKFKHNGNDVLLIKPQKYMNLSGECVIPLMDYYKIPVEKLLVNHDDIDSPYSSVKFQTARGHGGHNGIRNIHQLLGKNNYDRLKIGVSRPSNSKMDVADFVLQNFSKEEEQFLPELLDILSDSLESYISDGFQKTATNFNKVYLKDEE